MFFVVLGMLGLAAFVVWNGNNISAVMFLLIAGWAWLFGMNYLIAAIRFPIWLRSGLRSLSRT
jgi:hypothetical protein